MPVYIALVVVAVVGKIHKGTRGSCTPYNQRLQVRSDMSSLQTNSVDGNCSTSFSVVGTYSPHMEQTTAARPGGGVGQGFA